MMDDYYLLLGITRDAGMTQIRRAYRRLALRFHPEVAGDEGLEQFSRVKQAFETLSQPARRADYDRELEKVEQSRPVSFGEPLLAEPIDLVRDFGTVRPGTDELFQHILGNFTHKLPKSNPQKDLMVEIILSPEQAQRGGHVMMRVPVARVCGVCGGTGRAGFFVCESCGGHGTLWEKALVDVHIPKHIPDGGVVETSLRHLGIRNMWLKTLVRVAQTH